MNVTDAPCYLNLSINASISSEINVHFNDFKRKGEEPDYVDSRSHITNMHVTKSPGYLSIDVSTFGKCPFFP